MENINLIEHFAEFKELKNIDRATMMRVLEDVFKSTLNKQNGESNNFDVIINIDKGDFEIWRTRTVVKDEDFTDPVIQIPLSEAKKIEKDYEEGEDVSNQVKFEDFPRRTILALRQNLSSKILELEKDSIFSISIGIILRDALFFFKIGYSPAYNYKNYFNCR